MVNSRLDEHIAHAHPIPRIVSAMRHSLNAGGKRLRPILCMASAEAVGQGAESVIDIACALEMIHTYSLIHDDLPALDNDDLRRGLPTCHVAFDEATAIMAGDALLTLAFQVLSDPLCLPSVAAPCRLQLIHRIASASGYKGMIEGQMRDLAAEGKIIDRHELEQIHLFKTGALIEASVYAGALAGGASDLQIERLTQYARHIGLAFQVTDDVLNVEGDPAIMGKAVGSDADHRKATYPSLIGLEAAKHLAEQLVNDALRSLDIFDRNSDSLRSLAHYIVERKH
jgi:geranylgeranyl diphosphate synthase type II